MHEIRIYARVKNTEEKVGFVPLQNLGPKLLFGNFVASKKGGKAFARCYNTSDEPVRIAASAITLEPCEIVREKDEVFDSEDNSYDNEHEHASILQITLEEEEDRVTKVFKALDFDMLKDLNAEKITHIKELIKERLQLFGLPGKS